MDLTGQKYGRLTALNKEGFTTHRNILWKCICECGGYVRVAAGNLRSGHTRSCGCLAKETKLRVDNKVVKHGHIKNNKRSPTYQSWRCMRERCMHPSNASYPYYGGRGIRVCLMWEKFENFFEDMGERPKDHHIDRINPNNNYTPENCHWQHNSKMAQNKRRNHGT